MDFGRLFRRRLVVVATALTAGGAAFILLLHAPFVRSAALRRALPVIERQYGLRLEAARLDYNITALRIGLSGLRLSAPHAAGEPFFTADYLSVTFPWRSLLGELVFQDIGVANARVFVRRRNDGTTNLPTASEGPRDEPPPLRIARLDIPQLAMDIRDEQAVMNLWMPSIGLRLTPESGQVTLAREAELNTATQLTHISQLNGEASFDGRALHLMNLDVRTDEVSTRLNGLLTLIASEASVDLNVRGTGDVTRMARWAIANGELPRGDLAFEAEVTGTFNDLNAHLTATTDRLSWQNLAATDLAARMGITAAAVDVEELRFGFEGGRVTATGLLPFASDADGRVRASWTAVNAASAALALVSGTRFVPSASVSGELDLQGEGPDIGRWSGSVRVDLAPGPNVRGRIAIAGDAALRLTETSWSLEGRHVIGGVAPVTLALQGSEGASLQRTAIDGMVRIADTNLPALVAALRTTGVADVQSDVITTGTLEAEIRLDGQLADPVIDARAIVRGVGGPQIELTSLDAQLSGRPLQPSLEFGFDAPGAVVAGQPLTEVRAVGRLSGSALVIDQLSARQPSAPGRLTASGAYNLRTERYTVSVDGAQWRLTAAADQPVAGSVDLRFAGDGTVEEPRGTGRVTVREAMWRDMRLGGVDAAVEVDGQTAHIEAQAPDFAAAADGRVGLDAPYAAVVDAHAQGLDLSRLLQHVDTPAPIVGTTTVTIHAEAPLQTWRSGSAVLEIASIDARAGELPVRLVEPAHIRFESERVHVERFEVAAGETRMSALGSLPAFEAAPDEPGVGVTVTGDVGGVARAAAATGLIQLPVTGGDGPVALLARLNGTIQQPTVAADLEVGPGSVTLQDLPPVSRLRVRAHAENGWLELREAAAAYEKAELSVTGKAPFALLTTRRSDPFGPGIAEGVVHARAMNLTPAVLAPFVEPGTLEEVSGSVDATLDAASPTLDLADLTGELRIDRFDLRVADLPVTQGVPTRIVARAGFARVEAWEWVGQGATLAVRGQVRLEDRQAAILANGVVDLRVLTPFVRGAGMSTAGRLEPRLSITGALDSPRIDGDVVVTDGEIRLVDPRVLVSDLAVRTVLTRTTARITALAGSVNGGALTGDGRLEYSPNEGLGAQLSADIRGMALEFPQGLRSELDAALDLALQTRPDEEAPPSGRLSGTVTVIRSTYREPMAVVTGLLAGLRTQRLAAATEASPLLDALALDVRVITDEDVFVDNNYGRVQLGADLCVIGTAAAPGLSGRAEVREGGQLFVGRNVYTVNFGAIDFASPVAIEPNLNVEATTRAGGEDIEVTISGPAEGPTVSLRSTSNPDLGQAEVASLLLTGRRLEDLAPGDAAFVGTQVLGNFSAEVLGFASRAVGLDTLRLGGVENQVLRRDPTAVATELDPTTRLTFGKSLGSDVDVTLSQSLRDSDAQTWIVEYVPARGFELRLVSDDDDLRAYGFRHDVTFGTGSRPGQRPQADRSRQAARVANVEVSGNLVLPELRVRETFRLEPGDRFDFAAWQVDRDRVENLYRSQGYLTARVTARRSENAAGVVLTYEIAAGPQAAIAVSGIDLDSALRAQLEAAWSQSVFDDFLMDEAAQIARTNLARRGYLRPSIDVRIREEGTTKTMEIVVDPGTQSTRTTVRIDGAAEGLTSDITTHLAEGRLLARAVADPGAVEREVTAFLRARGHLRARVAAGAPLFEDAASVLPLSVDAGPVFTIASLAFEGAQALAADRLRETAALAEDMPYDPGVLEAARDRLLALHRREGFPAATVTARPTVRADLPAVDIAFIIEEGARQVLGEVVVVGNRAIAPDVIERALGLSAGSPLRAEDVLQARTRVFNTGLFRRIDVTSESGEERRGLGPVGPDVTDKRVVPMRLRVTVEEWPAARLRYGFVVAEERPENEIEGRELVPGLSADLTRRTVFGRAISVGTALALQRREQRGRVFLNAPTFLGLPVESSLITQRSREEFQAASLVTNRSSVTWEQSVRVARSLRLSYAYTFAHDHTFDTRPTDDPSLAFDVTINIARLNAAAAWDTRDDPTDTTRGLLASSSFELAPEAAGSDIRFVRQIAQAYSFRPWRNVVFASAARVGVAVPLEGQELILTERFFAGGSRTVRGVAESSLGPHDFFGAAGGRMMLVLNQEVRLPIYRWLRGVGFVDAGNVFTRPRDISLRDLVGSVGLGLRLATPFALLRVDYARTAWGAPEASGRWTFGIGQAF